MNNSKTGIYYGYPRQANEYWQNSLRKSSVTKVNKISRPSSSNSTRSLNFITSTSRVELKPNFFVEYQEMCKRLIHQESEIAKLQQDLRELIDPDKTGERPSNVFKKKDQARTIVSLKQQLYNLKQLVKNKENELASLKTELKFTDNQQLRSELDVSFGEIERLRKLLKDEREVNRSYASRYNKIVAKKENFPNQTEKMIKNLLERIKELDAQKSELMSENELLKNNGDSKPLLRVSKSTSENSDLVGEFIADDDTAKYIKDNVQKFGRIKSKVKFVSELNKSSEMKQEINFNKNEQENELKKAVDTLRLELHKEKNNCEKVKQDLSFYKEKHSNASKLFQDTKTQLDKISVEVIENRKQLEKIKEENEALKKNCKLMKQKLIKLNSKQNEDQENKKDDKFETKKDSKILPKPKIRSASSSPNISTRSTKIEADSIQMSKKSQEDFRKLDSARSSKKSSLNSSLDILSEISKKSDDKLNRSLLNKSVTFNEDLCSKNYSDFNSESESENKRYQHVFDKNKKYDFDSISSSSQEISLSQSYR